MKSGGGQRVVRVVPMLLHFLWSQGLGVCPLSPEVSMTGFYDCPIGRHLPGAGPLACAEVTRGLHVIRRERRGGNTRSRSLASVL